MNREMLEQHVAQAERLLARSSKQAAEQRRRIDELALSGHDVTAARELLKQLEQMQAVHIAELGRLRKELADGY